VVNPAPGGGSSVAATFHHKRRHSAAQRGCRSPQTQCNSDFYSNITIAAVCYTANLANCPNASNLNFTYSYDNPGIAQRDHRVFPRQQRYPARTETRRLPPITSAWAYEIVAVSNGPTTGKLPMLRRQTRATTARPIIPANIQVAACREATFLNFIFIPVIPRFTVEAGAARRGAARDRQRSRLPGYSMEREIIWMRWSWKSGPPNGRYQAGLARKPARST